MRFRVQPRRVCFVLFCTAVLLRLGPAAAQPPQQPTTTEAQSQPAVTTQPAASTPALSVSELQLLLQQAQSATDLTEDAKTKVEVLYTQAIQLLETAEQLAAKASEFDAERQAAPETLSAIKAELNTPLGEPKPDVPAGATRAELEQHLRQVQTDLDAEKKALADSERERDRRAGRRKEIPKLLAEAKARVQGLTESAAPTDAESAPMRLAQQSLNQARRLAAEREVDVYNSELLSYDARRDLLQARLDRSTRRIDHFEKLVAAWQTLVQERARQEAELALREAREQLKHAHPAIRPLAEEREQIALRAKALQAERKNIDARLTDIDAVQTQVSQDFEKISRQVNVAGLTNAIGQLLRRHRANLPSLRPSERSFRQLRDRMSAVEVAAMGLRERRKELMKADAILTQVMESIDPGTGDEQRAMIRQVAEETITALRADADSLLKDHNQISDKLVDLDTGQRVLVKTIERFEEYIDENVLWIRSGTWPVVTDIQRGREALTWLTDPSGWGAVLRSVGGTFRARGGQLVGGLAALFVLWLASPWLGRLVYQAGEVVSKPTKDNMGLTFGVLLATAGLAVRWPATLWLAGWIVASPYDATEFSRALASGLSSTAVIVLTLQSLRELARKNGLGEKHFRWSSRSLTRLKRNVAWLTVVLVPTFLVFATLDARTHEAAGESLGRLAFVIAFLAITLFVQRVLRPAGPILGSMLQRQQSGWSYRLRHVWYAIALALPIALVLAAIAGYYYTAYYLGTRFIASVWLLFGLIVLRALVKRWLLLQIRRRAIAEARERAALRQQQQQQEGEGATPAEQDAIPIPEDKLDVGAINKQTLQLVRVVLVVVGAIALWGIWADALPALGVFRGVTLWTITQQVSEAVPGADDDAQMREYTKVVPITVANVGLACLVTLITIAAVKNIPGLLEIAILRQLPIDASGRFAVTAITRYTITVVGVIIAFAQIGVGWSKVQWLIAAMTVGLGFGLQEIFANLVSGLMLLFERPIRIGDTVTVADISGTVMRIRTRATTIVGWDRKELIIPNKEFITGKVVNWTLSDSTIRIIVPVGIAYGSNTQRAREVLTQIVQELSNILADPPPRVLFMGFGDSSLNFEVRAYIGTIDHYLSTIDELHDTIDREFRKANIEIAFPQRDIHVRSIRGALPIVGEKAIVPPPGDA